MVGLNSANNLALLAKKGRGSDVNVSRLAGYVIVYVSCLAGAACLPDLDDGAEVIGLFPARGVQPMTKFVTVSADDLFAGVAGFAQ
jgi:hypothetical protein